MGEGVALKREATGRGNVGGDLQAPAVCPGGGGRSGGEIEVFAQDRRRGRGKASMFELAIFTVPVNKGPQRLLGLVPDDGNISQFPMIGFEEVIAVLTITDDARRGGVALGPKKGRG